MEKTQPLHYSVAVTYGRFNLPHTGHVELIQQMLAHGKEAHVYVSSARTNNDWDTRVLMLTQLCQVANVNLKRVKFLKSTDVFEAVSASVEYAPWNEVVVVLGSDQQGLGFTLARELDCAFIINKRTTSSTLMRTVIDSTEYIRDLVDHFYGDSYATALAMILRKEEINRATVFKSAAQPA